MTVGGVEGWRGGGVVSFARGDDELAAGAAEMEEVAVLERDAALLGGGHHSSAAFDGAAVAAVLIEEDEAGPSRIEFDAGLDATDAEIDLILLVGEDKVIAADETAVAIEHLLGAADAGQLTERAARRLGRPAGDDQRGVGEGLLFLQVANLEAVVRRGIEGSDRRLDGHLEVAPGRDLVPLEKFAEVALQLAISEGGAKDLLLLRVGAAEVDDQSVEREDLAAALDHLEAILEGAAEVVGDDDRFGVALVGKDFFEPVQLGTEPPKVIG